MGSTDQPGLMNRLSEAAWLAIGKGFKIVMLRSLCRPSRDQRHLGKKLAVQR